MLTSTCAVASNCFTIPSQPCIAARSRGVRLSESLESTSTFPVSRRHLTTAS
ncbi:hypothetical protein BDQ94DRAFT_139590 [Aspergillus welwitschiae]|uniref:Uncharacterized protein n=1 Tax=Aspergillus welwitschiae TaxID=1341132 RepID=A0A3F3Q862_9EURO|nr:hypothetical protein BDQ94DRAFT_139590 [Aspergillus welwitschiae]RDH35391.1 hypothetical protein BDQ94DRAFT_139590 [Aspergillus welwitschiae]